MALSFISQSYTQRVYQWTAWKAIQATKKFNYQYDDDGIAYTIWFYDDPEAYLCTIWKGTVPQSVINNGYSQSQNDSDKSDFESNYLAGANKGNTSLLPPGDLSGSGSISALNGTVVATVNGQSTIVFSITGTFTATLTIQASVDNGVSYFGTQAYQSIPGAAIQTINAPFPNTLIAGCGGYTHIRLIATSYTSGTVNISWRASIGDNAMQIFSFAAQSCRVSAELKDGSGNFLTSQVSGSQRPLDIGINVAGAQIDPRGGNIASGVADSGNPLKMGFKAESTFIAAVSDGNRVDAVSDLYGRQRTVIHPDDIKRLGVYYYTCGALLVQASADAATAGRAWLINPVGSSVTVRVRKIIFRTQLGSALAAITSPRITIERITFTGTASGATITPAKRKSVDATNVSSLRTASTGLTLTAGSIVTEFLPIASATAVGYAAPGRDELDAGLEDYTDLVAGEGLVVRQPDAGTTADTRRFIVNFIVDEF